MTDNTLRLLAEVLAGNRRAHETRAHARKGKGGRTTNASAYEDGMAAGFSTAAVLLNTVINEPDTAPEYLRKHLDALRD